MKDFAETRSTRYPFVSLLIMFCLFAVQVATASAEAQFRELPYDGIDYDNSSDDNENTASDPQQEYDEDNSDGGSFGQGGNAASPSSLEGLPGYGPCSILKGEKCYTTPNRSEESDGDGVSQPPDTHSQPFPDQSQTSSPFGSPGNSGGRSPVASPFATPGSGGLGAGVNSPFSNPAGVPGSTVNSNGLSVDANAITADCRRTMSAASNSFMSCAKPSAQQGICHITRNLASCGERIIQKMQYSSCPERMKRSNIDSLRQVVNQARAAASSSCAN